MSLWSKLGRVVKKAIDAIVKPPTPSPPREEPRYPLIRQPRPEPELHPSLRGDHPGFYDFQHEVPPLDWLPTAPPEAEWNDLGDFAGNLGINDEYAIRLLDRGWFDEDASADDRHYAREHFFEYTGLYEEDFPWDEWREWYEAT